MASVVKPIVKAIDDVLPAAKAVAKTDAALDVVQQTRVRQGLKRNVEDIFSEYDELKQTERTPVEPFSSKEEVLKILEEEGARMEVERVDSIFDPKSDPLQGFQTMDRGEFRRRYWEQLQDTDYSARSVNAIVDSTRGADENAFLATRLKSINEGKIVDVVFQSKATKGIKGNKRKEAFIQDWLGDSPYTISKDNPSGQVMVHVERQSNPFQQEKGLIQFGDNPNELGVHSGTNQAAIRATIKSEESAMQQMDDFDEWTKAIIGLSDEPRDIEEVIGDTINEFFINKFRTTDKMTSEVLFQDFDEMLTPLLLEFGAPPAGTLKTLKARIRQLPTANSTPHYFRGKNGLLMEDRGGWFKEGVKIQLTEIFPDSEFDTIRDLDGWRSIQKYIEDQGYDHIIYHNTVEDVGSISTINWNPDLMLSVYDPKIAGADVDHTAKVVAGMVISSLGLASAQGAKDANLRN